MRENEIKKREIFFLLALVLLVFAFRLQFMHMPLDRDEGASAYIAERTFHGDLPYADTFGSNGPFVYYIYKTAFTLFGISDSSLRIFTCYYLVFTMLLVFIIVRTVSGRAPAFAAALFYALFMQNHNFRALGAYSEIFTHFPLMLAFLLLLDRESYYEKVNLAAAGFFMGAAFYVNMAAGVVFLVPVLYLMLYEKPGLRRIKSLLWYLGGFFLLSLLVFIWAAVNGILQRFMEQVFVYGFKEPARGGLFFETLKYGAEFIKTSFIPAAAVVYSLVKFLRGREGRVNFMFFSATAFLVVLILVQNTAHPRHYLLLMPFITVLAAFMIFDIFNAVRKKAGRTPAAVCATLVVLLSAGLFLKTAGTGNYMRSGSYGPEIFDEARAVSAFINRYKTENSSVFVWPDEPEIYFLSQIKAPFRFISSRPFDVYPQEKTRVFRALAKNPPDFMVIQKGEGKEFDFLIKNYYKVIIETNSLILYKTAIYG